MSQSCDLPFTIFNRRLELTLSPFELPSLKINLLILLLNQLLQLPPLIPQTLSQLVIMILHGRDISFMHMIQPLLQVEQLPITLPLLLMQLLLEEFNIQIMFFMIFSLFFKSYLQLFLQILDIFIFYLQHCFQSLEFCLEFLVLIAHVFVDVSQLTVHQFFELVLDPANLPIFLVHHLQVLLPHILNIILQPLDLLLPFLGLPFFPQLSSLICSVHILPLLELLIQLSYLRLVVFLCLTIALFDEGEFLFNSLGSSCLLLNGHRLASLLCLDRLFFPKGDIFHIPLLLKLSLASFVTFLLQFQQEQLLLLAQFLHLLLPP